MSILMCQICIPLQILLYWARHYLNIKKFLDNSIIGDIS